MKQVKEHKVRELPILMNGFSVRAILAGRKTQTRRVIKPQPSGKAASYEEERVYPWPYNNTGWRMSNIDPMGNYFYRNIKPKYQVGDRLWVRETWNAINKKTDNACPYNEYPPRLIPQKEVRIIYKAGFHMDLSVFYPKFNWRPSIYMPKWAARIWLEVVNVRAERVQDILVADILNEGVWVEPPLGADPSPPIGWNKMTKKEKEAYCKNASRPIYISQCHHIEQLKKAFEELWDSINGKKYPWASNPWVWVYEFKKIERGE